jgi:hypothetical protein
MNDQPCNQLWLQKGASVANNGREYVILAIADINLLLARDRESGEKVLLKIGELGPPLAVEGKKPDIYESVGGVKRKRQVLSHRDVEGSQGRPQGVHLDP